MKSSWKQSWAIARKELGAYFGSPMALIFVGAFLVITLFAFFWGETFFARNIADVRPLFKWMPILLIFLVGALTMRQWSEEQRAGTLEVLLTLPVRRTALVWGKFMAVMMLVTLSLALTLFLPISVSILGNLDWGPVVGGYLAAILMASAYTAIGLFISSRTDNQIVALLLTILLGGAFYLVGTDGVTQLSGGTVGEILRAIGTGSRFESIQRGVIDLRDLIYYLSLTALFLVLTVVSLDSKRWSKGARTAGHRWNAILRVVLVAANLFALNAWLFPLHRLRADVTANREYSLSPATRELISNLNEPLLMRGYFSDRTHPLLAPLVPTLTDIMQEYEIVSGGKVKVEILDPRDNEDIEAEANQVYGIRPTPFRIAGRYEDTVLSSYFNVLIRYGDQNVTLGFDSLIEVEPAGGGQMEVGLRNPEYDLTRSIKKVVYGFQSLDAVFASMEEPVKLTVVITPDTLPPEFGEVAARIEEVADDLTGEAGGKFIFETVNPDAPDSPMSRQDLFDSYGIRPFSVSLFSPDTYYLHLLLQIGDDVFVTYPTGDMAATEIRSDIEAALKRAAPGFLKTVGIWSPSEEPVQSPFGGTSPPISTWQMVRQQLSQDYTVKQVDLSSGRVPGDIDVLVVIAPNQFTDRERFAIDQYLMRGGAVIAAAGEYVIAPIQMGGLMMAQIDTGIADMLGHYGVTVGPGMVMDPQNEPFPMQVQRKVSGYTMSEIKQIDYPYFVDVRRDGMAADSPIVANLPAVTLQWTSPLQIDEEKNKDRDVVTLLKSTDTSWIRTEDNVEPDLEKYPQFGFPIEGEQDSRLLAVSIRGSFESYFKDRPSPFQESAEANSAGGAQGEQGQTEGQTPALGTLEVSPESSRLVVIGSGEFLDDAALGISRRQSPERYLNNLQFLQNAVDWAVEDEDLLTIRTRGTYARLLPPLSSAQQSLWEGLNYAVALIGLAIIGLVWNSRRRHEEPMELVAVEQSGVEEER